MSFSFRKRKAQPWWSAIAGAAQSMSDIGFLGFTAEQWRSMSPRQRWYYTRLATRGSVPTLPETGADAWAQLGSYVGEEVLTPAVIQALQAPETQAELQKVLVKTLEADETKRALRPYAVEAAIWATLAITLGAAAWRWITRR